MAIFNFCPRCGFQLPDKARFCSGCGAGVKNMVEEILKDLSEGKGAYFQFESAMLSNYVTPESVPVQPVSKSTDKGTQPKPESTSSVVLQAKQNTTRKIRCTVCRKTYESAENGACPTCGYPALSVVKNSLQLKTAVQDYRKKAGIQSIELKVGQYHKMGTYGGEAINWRVLAVEEGKALLISEKGLDAKRYHEKYEDVTWETCSLRKWLNGDFMNSVFTAEEKGMINKTQVKAEKNPDYNTNPGKDTEDKIFLLSIQEAEKYFASNQDRQAKPTELAIKNSAYVSDSTKCCWWWLRSPGSLSNDAAGVYYDGSVFSHGYRVDDGILCVRPALWVNL